MGLRILPDGRDGFSIPGKRGDGELMMDQRMGMRKR